LSVVLEIYQFLIQIYDVELQKSKFLQAYQEPHFSLEGNGYEMFLLIDEPTDLGICCISKAFIWSFLH